MLCQKWTVVQEQTFDFNEPNKKKSQKLKSERQTGHKTPQHDENLQRSCDTSCLCDERNTKMCCWLSAGGEISRLCD